MALYIIFLTFVVVGSQNLLFQINARCLRRLTCTQSVFIESFATQWDHWLVAKLFSGMGVGMLQSTMPLYLSELAPTQLRGLLINAYSL